MLDHLREQPRPLRILVIIHDFEPGGAERIAIRLASRWSESGQQVAIACGSLRGALRSLVGDGVQILTPANPIHRSRLSRFAVAAFGARIASEFSPDLIFLPGNYYAGMAPFLRLRLGRRCPPIVTKLSNMLRRKDRGIISQAAFQAGLAFKTAFAERIILMSPELRDEARRCLPWPDACYRVIAQPVLDDEEKEEATANLDLAQPGAGKDVPLLVAAGRLTAQKNFLLLVDAAGRLDVPFLLTIHGEGPERARIEASIANSNLSDHVRLVGYTENMKAALAGARLFILSSDYEGFPSVLVEALADGVPIVATDCSPAIATIMRLASEGELVPPGDPTALADAIKRSLRRSRPDREELVRAVEPFRIGSSATAYLSLFRELAHRQFVPESFPAGGV